MGCSLHSGPGLVSPWGIPTGALRGSLEQIEQDEGVPLGSEPRTEEGTMTPGVVPYLPGPSSQAASRRVSDLSA